MKTDISLTYHIKPQKQRETYVLFCSNTSLEKTKIKSFLLFCFLSHVSPCGVGRYEGGER